MQEQAKLPKISVIIPTYNRADFIAEAIQSVIDQTYPDWELIVLDDGSTDNTAEIVSRFDDKRLKYIYQNNAGETSARNAGIALAQGELLSFLDSDDCMLPSNLESLVTLLNERPEVDVAYGWYYWMKSDGQPLMWENPKIEDDGYVEHASSIVSPWPGVSLPPSGATLEGQIFSRLILEETMMIGSALFRRACVETVGGFTPNIPYQGHWDFYLRIAGSGFTYACCKKPVVLLRIHNSAASKNWQGMQEGRENVLKRLFADAAMESVPAQVRRRAYARAHLDFIRWIWEKPNFLEEGPKCLNGALRYAPLHPDDVMRLSEWMISVSLSPKVKDPVKFVRDYFVLVDQTPEVHRIHNKILADLNATLAFRHCQMGELSRVWRYAVSAIIHDPKWLRNRGLIRIGLEGLLGSKRD